MDLAVREADYDTWDRLIVKAKKATLPADMLITARGRLDSAAIARNLRALPADPRGVTFATRYLWIYYGDAGLAQQVGEIGTNVGDADARAFTNLALAELDVARGRWQSARSRLRNPPVPVAFDTQIFRWVCHTLPFLPMAGAELQAASAEVESWNGSAPAHSDPTKAAMMPHARLYLLGLLEARLGRYPAAERLAAQLEQLPDVSGQPAVRRDLALTVRAQVAAEQGRHADVIDLLQPLKGQIPLPLMRRKDLVPSDLLFAQDHARFLRIVALRELGRSEEAVQWSTTSFMGAPGEMLYRAPLQLQLAQAYDQLEDPTRARQSYADFLAAWQYADPRFQPQVNAARKRLTQLSGDR